VPPGHAQPQLPRQSGCVQRLYMVQLFPKEFAQTRSRLTGARLLSEGATVGGHRARQAPDLSRRFSVVHPSVTSK
jgi:hypothetical protein